MKRKPLSVMTDFVFKMIFGDARNIDILANFLKAVLPLPPDEFNHLTIVDPFIKRETETDKMSVVDVKVHTTSGKIIDVEIQVAPTPDIARRIVYYSVRMLREQMRRGGKYQDLRQVICVLITNFVFLSEEEDYYNEISLRNAVSGREFTDVLKYVILELPKLPEKADARQAWSWLKFIKSESEEDLMEVVERNPQLRKPVGVYLEMTEEECLREIEEKQEIFRMDQEARIDGAYEDGKKAGEKTGWEEHAKQAYAEKLESARKMKTWGDSTAKIAHITGLSPEEIERL
ncbi:MAG: Rpn family recombination-promoting nuclease/putative transposase [Spirochaetaceae bacterium]|nr:Rpn family recombination-promoting nuclease/putative transposase [Spirochaetaceae bacterium]